MNNGSFPLLLGALQQLLIIGGGEKGKKVWEEIKNMVGQATGIGEQGKYNSNNQIIYYISFS